MWTISSHIEIIIHPSSLNFASNIFIQNCPSNCAFLVYHRSESENDEEEEGIPLLSEEEMNKLGAKLVKAEIMGNMVRGL